MNGGDSHPKLQDTCLSDCCPCFILNSAPRCPLDQFMLLLLSQLQRDCLCSHRRSTITYTHTPPTATVSSCL